jgi:hypothetical protein
VRIIYRNLVDEATLTASPAMVATLPVSHLQTDAREEVARSVGLASQTIDIATAAPQVIMGCVLYRGNFTSAATWRVRVYDTPAMGTLLYDSGSLLVNPPKPLGDLQWGIEPLGTTIYDGWGYTVSELWIPPVVASFTRLTLDDAANPDGFMQLSRVFLGAYLEPEYMPAPGMSMQRKETTKQERSAGGTLHTEAGAQFRALTVGGRFIPETTRANLSTMEGEVGMRKDVYVSVYPDQRDALARDHRMQAKLVSIDPMTTPFYRTADHVLRFEEV